MLRDQLADHLVVQGPVAGDFFAIERLNMAIPGQLVLRRQPQGVPRLPPSARQSHALPVVIHLQDRGAALDAP